jgi:predicted transcriptional regulator
MIAKMEHPESGILYHATEKGIEFLKDYARLSAHLQ